MCRERSFLNFTQASSPASSGLTLQGSFLLSLNRETATLAQTQGGAQALSNNNQPKRLVHLSASSLTGGQYQVLVFGVPGVLQCVKHQTKGFFDDSSCTALVFAQGHAFLYSSILLAVNMVQCCVIGCVSVCMFT